MKIHEYEELKDLPELWKPYFEYMLKQKWTYRRWSQIYSATALTLEFPELTERMAVKMIHKFLKCVSVPK